MNARLMLLVLVSMASAASAGIMSVNFADQKQLAVFCISVALAGLTTAKSFFEPSNPPKP